MLATLNMELLMDLSLEMGKPQAERMVGEVFLNKVSPPWRFKKFSPNLTWCRTLKRTNLTVSNFRDQWRTFNRSSRLTRYSIIYTPQKRFSNFDI